MSKEIKIKKGINKIESITLNIVVIFTFLLIIVGIYYLIQIKILHNPYPNIFGYTVFEVATGSMSGTIEIGDAVIVEITKEVKENDIIVYQEEENFITHRLIRNNENDELIAKGDANNTEDSPIQRSQVLGKVVKILPKIGILRRMILSSKVLILVISSIIVLGIIHKAINSKKKNI